MESKEKHGPEEWVSEIKAEELEQESERLEKEELKRQVLKDDLTELWNQKGLMEVGKALIAERQRENNPTSLMYLDLDGLGELNARFGHPKVNGLLKELGQHLKSISRQNDVVAHLHGDEFVILLAASKDNQALKKYLKPYVTEVNGEKVVLTFTGGIEDIDLSLDEEMKFNPQEKLQEAIERADDLMMNIKKSRKKKSTHTA